MLVLVLSLLLLGNYKMSKTAGGILAFLRASSLKHVERAGWVQHGVPGPERVAGHSWRLALMAMMLERTEGGVRRAGSSGAVDMGRVMRMAIVHDIAEADVGDITPTDGVAKVDKMRLEAAAVARYGAMLAGSPAAGAAVATASLFAEYEEDETPEAHVCHELDKFDMIVQAFEVCITLRCMRAVGPTDPGTNSTSSSTRTMRT